ncbi:MAG TPA: hypothetical protein DFR83_01865, partial [Deltaproteobacteria bacterium]|nr:hypothetical protein [Deltaproteobacteria bacterium]
DTDGDGFGDEDRSLDACALPSGYVDRAEDCDDDNGAVNPDSVEVCDDIDNDCDSRIDDDDDDVDPSTFRDFYADGDRDGYGTGEVAESACSTPDGYADTNDDCNDDNAD